MVEFPDAESRMLPSTIASSCAPRIVAKFSMTVCISMRPFKETVLFPGFRRTS